MYLTYCRPYLTLLEYYPLLSEESSYCFSEKNNEVETEMKVSAGVRFILALCLLL